VAPLALKKAKARKTSFRAFESNYGPSGRTPQAF
jgi:hypothetical protein